MDAGERLDLVARLAARAAPERPQALPASGRGQPAAEGVRIPDLREVLDQPQPARLHDVGRVAGPEPVPASDAPHKARVARDEIVPRALVATGRRADETCGRGAVARR